MRPSAESCRRCSLAASWFWWLWEGRAAPPCFPWGRHHHMRPLRGERDKERERETTAMKSNPARWDVSFFLPVSLAPTCVFLTAHAALWASTRGRQEVLEPLLLLSSGAAEQVEGDWELVVCCRHCRLPLHPLPLLLLTIEHALLPDLPLGQRDADGVLPVPQPLSGQTGRQQRHLGCKIQRDREKVATQLRNLTHPSCQNLSKAVLNYLCR